jgi:ribosome maturation factor RimP
MRENSRRDASRPPDQHSLARLLEPVVSAMGMDVEGIKIARAGRRQLLRIVVDADGGVSLDKIAEVSREIAARLDAQEAMGDEPYTLEVSSPGVDRPLTQPLHWRRAAGRLVSVPVGGDGSHQEGRIIGADDEGVTLDVGGARRTFGYGELGAGRVRVEFGQLADADAEDGDGH